MERCAAGLDLPASPLRPMPRGGAWMLGGWWSLPGVPRVRCDGLEADVFLTSLPRQEDPQETTWDGFRVLLSGEIWKPGRYSIELLDSDGKPLQSADLLLEEVEAPPEAWEAPPEFAICMATYQPDLELFRRQIDSIRSQTREDWVCLLQDDGSDAESLAGIRQVLGEDSRFRLQLNSRNLGFYRNFEACLSRIPPGVRWVVLSDQDDVWYPDKLDALGGTLERGAQLAYSDCRLVDRAGEVLSETFWTRKENCFGDFSTQILANSVSGSAAAFRRELLDFALPFPLVTGPSSWGDKLYHDHWLAVVAQARGEVAYLDRPLHDYVQHEGADTGHFDRSRAHRESQAAGAAARRVRLGTLVSRERARARLFLENLRLRRALLPHRVAEAESLLQADSSLGAHLRWLLRRGMSGRFARQGWKLWLRRLETMRIRSG